VPPLRQNEQNIKLGTFDPFDAKGAYLGRAVLHLAREPMAREKTNEAFNPRLEETFFYSIPRDRRYVVDASVMIYAHPTMISRRQMTMETGELLIPVPLELDIKPTDKAIYIGTMRLHRDEFNEVTKVELLDQSGKAAVEFKNKFGSNAVFRKAPVKMPASIGRRE
jgi:hypothetical protein